MLVMYDNVQRRTGGCIESHKLQSEDLTQDHTAAYLASFSKELSDVFET